MIDTINTIAALRALTSTPPPPTIYMVLGYYSVSGAGGGLFRYDSADTTSADNGGTTIVDNANRRWKREIEDEYYIDARWWGSIGDGASHKLSGYPFATLTLAQAIYPHAYSLDDQMDGVAIQAAINTVASARRLPVVLGKGTFFTSHTLTTFIGAGRGITIIGSPDIAGRQGSSLTGTPSILVYVGTGSVDEETLGEPEPVLASYGPFNNIKYVAIANAGNSSSALYMGFGPGSNQGGGRNHLDTVSIEPWAGAVVIDGITKTYTPYTVAGVYFTTTDYNIWERLKMEDSGPGNILFENASRPIGFTQVLIRDSQFSAAGGATDFFHFKFKDASAEILSFSGCAFRSGVGIGFTPTSAVVTVIDCSEIDNGSDPSAPDHVDMLNFHNCEIDYYETLESGAVTKPFNLKNVYAMNVDGCQFMSDNSTIAGLMWLNNSVVRWGLNVSRFFTGALFTLEDSLSRIIYDYPEMTNPIAVTQHAGGRMKLGTPYTDPVVNVVPAGSPNLFARILGQNVDPRSIPLYRITMTTADNFQILVSSPGDGVYGDMWPGQVFEVEIYNNSGGAMGNISWNTVTFDTVTNFPKPANGARSRAMFRWTGTKAYLLNQYNPLGAPVVVSGDTGSITIGPITGSTPWQYVIANTDIVSGWFARAALSGSITGAHIQSVECQAGQILVKIAKDDPSAADIGAGTRAIRYTASPTTSQWF